MDEISFFFLFSFFMDCLLYTAKQAYIYYSSIISTIRERERSPVRSHESIDRAQFKVSPKGTAPVQNFEKQSSPPPLFIFFFLPPPPSHLIQPQNQTLIIPRLPIQIQPRRHITFPPIRPIIRTIPIPRFRLQPLQFQRRRCRFNHGELLKCEHNRGGFVGREELDRGPVFRC